ncbi:MAG: glycerate kinase [Chloroflexi bacterium]|nr:glycerate kinase [Chloroflexota bacterium]
MRVLVAPQEFKRSLNAEEAAAAIARGIRRARPDWVVDQLPLSDGGPGFLDALRRAVKADTAGLAIHDALGRRILGRYLLLRGSRVAVVEAAQANGLFHLAPGELDPLGADSLGVGELLLAAAGDGPPRIIVGVGGSATTDGGAGMARALGARFLDAEGRELRPGGGPLVDLAAIAWDRPAVFDGIEIVVATDVTNPLVGPNGAAAVYGPQKGATPEQVVLLGAAMERFAHAVRQCLGVDVGDLPGAGAAGGLAAGLVAFLGARIASGFDVVAEATGFAGRLAQADVVVTGEGSFDVQSVQGKVTGRVRAWAAREGKPCVVFAGVAEGSEPGVFTLSAIEPDLARSMANAEPLLERVAERWAAELAPERRSQARS